jgi:hypothetical protein
VGYQPTRKASGAKLSEVSEKARDRMRPIGEGYQLITAQNSAAAMERNDQKREGG